MGPDASIVRKGRLMSVWEGGNGLGGVEGKRSGVRGGSRVIGWNMTQYIAHSYPVTFRDQSRNETNYIVTCIEEDSSILAFSAASLTL